MGNSHHCPSAVERIKPLAVMMNRTIAMARACGISIIYAPSGCSKSYTQHPAREYVLKLPKVPMPTPRNHSQPVFPIVATDGGCDVQDGSAADGPLQIATLHIDDSDAIVEDDGGQEMFNVLSARKIKNIVCEPVKPNCTPTSPLDLKLIRLRPG